MAALKSIGRAHVSQSGCSNCQVLHVKLRLLSPPPASLKGTQASRNEFEIRRGVASTSVCTGARIWGRSSSRTQILKTRSGAPTSSHQSAFATDGVCKHTYRPTHSGVTDQKLRDEQKLNSNRIRNSEATIRPTTGRYRPLERIKDVLHLQLMVNFVNIA